MLKDYIPCSNEMVDFLYDLCRNASVLGIDRIGIKDSRLGGTFEFRLFLMADVPNFVPFAEAGIVRVNELYKRLRYFKESAKGEISVFYNNVAGSEEASKMLFRAENMDLEFRFGRLKAVGKRIVYSINEPIENEFLLTAPDRMEILKGIKAMDLEDITFESRSGEITVGGRDGIGDNFTFRLSGGRSDIFDFKRTFNSGDFRKLVQHFNNKDDCIIRVSDKSLFMTRDGNNDICAFRKDV